MMNSLDSGFDSQKFLSQQSTSNSQKSTQDMITQSSGSQERGNEKMSMYEKWLGKKSLYKLATPVENKIGVWASCPSQASSLNQPKYNSSNKPHVPDNSHKATEGRLSLYHMNKAKAYERDERDLLEQITFSLQENNNEMKGFVYGMKDSMESLKVSLGEELQQTVSSFQDSMKKLQDDIQFSLQVKEQVFHEIEDLKTVMLKKDSEIANLLGRLQVVEKRKDDEFAQFAKNVSDELKVPQEIITKKLEQISEKTGQVMENLNVYKESYEHEMKDSQNLLKTLAASIKDSEKRLMKEFKKIEPESITPSKIGEAMEGCFENWLAEVQRLIKQNIDSFTKKKGMELKDAVTQQQRKNLDTCLRKHLQTVSDKMEDVSQMIRSQQNLQESLLQAAGSWDYDKIKKSVEQCKSTIEDGELLLKQIDQSLKHCSNHFCGPDHLETSKSLRRENDSVHSSTVRKNNSQVFQVDRSSTETGQKARFSHWNRGGQQMQYKAAVNEQGVSNLYSHNHPESTTWDISYQVHQNSSFSSPNGFAEEHSTGKQHLSSCLTQHPTRTPVINEFVKTKKIVMKSNPKVSAISPFCQPKSCKINPSPVATIKPQMKINQTMISNMWKENDPHSQDHNIQQNFKYDLRKRKMRDVPYYPKSEKEAKLFLNKTSQNNPASSHTLQKVCKGTPDTIISQSMKPVSKCQKSSNHDSQCFDVQSSKQNFHPGSRNDSFRNDIPQEKDNFTYHFKEERRIPSYLTWNNSRQNVTTGNYQGYQNPSEEAKSGISSPCYKLYSIAMQAPLQQVPTSSSARRAGQAYHNLMIGRQTTRNSPHPTLLSDM